jgi:hypothetical protein
MNIPDLRAELEADRAWREGEVRSLQNLGESLRTGDEKDQYRRSLVLMLYAHFEGFCKFALSLYCSAINRARIQCSEADSALAAASLSEVFRDLRNPNKKSDVFRRVLPDDAKLHIFAREKEFLEKSVELMKRLVEIPDGAVDMESNLTPTVLSKNLFRLGFDHNACDEWHGDINRLLEFRNKVGHGEMRSGIPEGTYIDLRKSVDRVMTAVTLAIINSLQEKDYLRTEGLY